MKHLQVTCNDDIEAFKFYSYVHIITTDTQKTFAVYKE